MVVVVVSSIELPQGVNDAQTAAIHENSSELNFLREHEVRSAMQSQGLDP